MPDPEKSNKKLDHHRRIVFPLINISAAASSSLIKRKITLTTRGYTDVIIINIITYYMASACSR